MTTLCPFFGSNEIKARSNVFGTSADIFGNVRKSSENRRKSSEVAVTFPEIPAMTRRKSHTFDQEKVCSYRNKHFKLLLTWTQKCLSFSCLWSDTIDVPEEGSSMTLRSLNGPSSPCIVDI